MVSRYVLLSLLGITLVGCAPAPVVKVPYFIEVPSHLTVPCELAEPPAVDAYLALPIEERELKALAFGRVQTFNGIVCGDRVTAIRQWSNDQFKLFNLKEQ